MIDYALFMIDLLLCKCGARHNLIAEHLRICINDWKEMNQKRAKKNENKKKTQTTKCTYISRSALAAGAAINSF